MFPLRTILVFLGLALLPQLAIAQSKFLYFDIPYVVYEIDEYVDGLWFYSDLTDYPEMYGFSLSATTTVRFSIDAIDHTDRAPGFSGIVVKDKGQDGVREVGRFLANDASWEVYTDSRTQMQYRMGPSKDFTLGPGDYRVEVSTPNNHGRYVLKLGPATAPESGYIQTLREIRSTQLFHGYGVLHVFRTAHVYVPPLIVFVGLGIFVAYRYVRRRKPSESDLS